MLTKEKILANKARREGIEAKIEEREAPIRAHNANVAMQQLKAMENFMVAQGMKPSMR